LLEIHLCLRHRPRQRGKAENCLNPSLKVWHYPRRLDTQFRALCCSLRLILQEDGFAGFRAVGVVGGSGTSSRPLEASTATHGSCRVDRRADRWSSVDAGVHCLGSRYKSLDESHGAPGDSRVAIDKRGGPRGLHSSFCDREYTTAINQGASPAPPATLSSASYYSWLTMDERITPPNLMWNFCTQL
jgi:hypothetical protein